MAVRIGSVVARTNVILVLATFGFFATVFFVVVLIVVGVLFRDKLFGGNTASSGEKKQAVFLTNGQVYFGNLSNENDQYVKLTDIYYLQVNQPTQGSQDVASASQQQQQQGQLTLVKLGLELHGPEDEMRINRDQILFTEDIKADGRVAQAIAEYKKNPNASQQAQGQGQPNGTVGGANTTNTNTTTSNKNSTK